MSFCKRILLVTAIVSQVAVASAQSVAHQSGAGVAWQTDLDAARATAERDQKLLLIHFYNENCPPCRVLDATVFNQPTVAGAVHSHYVPVKLNTNEFPATAERFGITRIPTDVVITPQGKLIERMTSPGTPMAYIGQMAGIAEQHRSQQGRNFATAGANNGTSQPVNSAYSALSVAADANSFTAPSATTAPVAPVAAPVTANPYAQPGTVATPVAAAAPPVANAQSNPAAVAIANPYANQPVTPLEAAPSTPPAVPAATPPATKVASAAPQLPPNSPPLGFFGYCPVTMKKENNWKPGDVRWGCYHRGRTYLFSSGEARDEFLKDGDAYAPALSGIDPVLAIDSNEVAQGKKEFGIEFDGHFYLFSSESNLRKFYNQPQHYATGVRQAMLTAPEGVIRR